MELALAHTQLEQCCSLWRRMRTLSIADPRTSKLPRHTSAPVWYDAVYSVMAIPMESGISRLQGMPVLPIPLLDTVPHGAIFVGLGIGHGCVLSMVNPWPHDPPVRLHLPTSTSAVIGITNCPAPCATLRTALSRGVGRLSGLQSGPDHRMGRIQDLTISDIA